MIRNEMVTVVILCMFKSWLAKWQNCKQRIKMFLGRLFSLRSQRISLADPGYLSNMYYNGFLIAFHNPYSILKRICIGRSKIDCVQLVLVGKLLSLEKQWRSLKCFQNPNLLCGCL